MAVVRPATPERLSAEERREVLLDAAGAIVAEAGPGDVTIGAVAQRAGVTRALVYKHFDDKRAVLVALFRREAGRVDRAIRAAVEAAPDGFEPKLRAYVAATLDAVAEHRPYLAPLREARADPAARDDQRRRDGRMVRYFARFAERDFGVDDRTARTVIAVMATGVTSLLAQARRHPDAFERDYLVDTYVQMTVGGLTRLAAQQTDRTRPST